MPFESVQVVWLLPGQMAGVETAAAAVEVDDWLDSGPVYGADDKAVVVCPIPKGIVLVLPTGATEERLVVYDEVGLAPGGIW